MKTTPGDMFDETPQNTATTRRTADRSQRANIHVEKHRPYCGIRNGSKQRRVISSMNVRNGIMLQSVIGRVNGRKERMQPATVKYSATRKTTAGIYNATTLPYVSWYFLFRIFLVIAFSLIGRCIIAAEIFKELPPEGILQSFVHIYMTQFGRNRLYKGLMVR